VSEAVYRVFSQHYEESLNLSVPECRALTIIAEHGTLSPTAVGQQTAMDKVKVSRVTQSLVAKGLASQRQDPRDGRGRLLRLTRKGVAIHAKIVPLAMRLEAVLFADLSRTELIAFNRALTKITTRLETTSQLDPA